jgi:outer membrane cobalamin receptor
MSAVPFLTTMFRVTTLAMLASLGACAHGASQQRVNSPSGPTVITSEQIERSGAHSAWDVLKREAPMLTLRDDRNGRPSRMGRRGSSSIVLDDPPVVVVDGVRLGNFRDLDRIPASTILSITVYTGIDGTTYYGTNAVSGVVVIETKHGADS